MYVCVYVYLYLYLGTNYEYNIGIIDKHLHNLGNMSLPKYSQPYQNNGVRRFHPTTDIQEGLHNVHSTTTNQLDLTEEMLFDSSTNNNNHHHLDTVAAAESLSEESIETILRNINNTNNNNISQ